MKFRYNAQEKVLLSINVVPPPSLSLSVQLSDQLSVCPTLPVVLSNKFSLLFLYRYLYKFAFWWIYVRLLKIICIIFPLGRVFSVFSLHFKLFCPANCIQIAKKKLTLIFIAYSAFIAYAAYSLYASH